MSNNYSDYLKVRVTPEQKFKAQERAGRNGFNNVSDYARSVLFPEDAISVTMTADTSQAMNRLAAVEKAISSTPKGKQSLTAAQRALNLINREEDNDNQE